MLNMKMKHEAGQRARQRVGQRKGVKLQPGGPGKASPRVAEGDVSVETRKEESQLWGFLAEELSRQKTVRVKNYLPWTLVPRGQDSCPHSY